MQQFFEIIGWTQKVVWNLNRFSTTFCLNISLSTFDATEPCPAFVDFGGLDVEPLAVNAAEFFDLFVQQTGQHDASALFGAGGEHFAEHAQGVGEDVGDDDVELSLRQAVGQVELCINVVLCGTDNSNIYNIISGIERGKILSTWGDIYLE